MTGIPRLTPPTLDELAESVRKLEKHFAGTTEPTFPKPGQLWFDTATAVMKVRKSDGSGWMSAIGATSFRVAGFDGAGTLTLGAMPACVVTGVVLVSSGATTSDGSNLYTIKVRNATAAADLGAAKSTNGADLAANTAWALTTTTNLTLAANDVLTLVVTETGTATDLTAAQICATVFYNLSA